MSGNSEYFFRNVYMISVVMVKLVFDIFKIIRLLNRKLIGIHPFIHSLATSSRPIIWTRTSILFQAPFSFHHTNHHNISSTHTNLNTNSISSITVVIPFSPLSSSFSSSITFPTRQFHPVQLAFLFLIPMFQSLSRSLPPAIQPMVQALLHTVQCSRLSCLLTFFLVRKTVIQIYNLD